MSAPAALPYRTPLFSAADMSAITGVNRSTSQGWIARYSGPLTAIGIEEGARGVAREFTVEQLGIFAALRVATSVRQADAAFKALEEIAEHATSAYAVASAGIEWHSYRGNADDRRPLLPRATKQKHLEGRHIFGSDFVFHVTDNPYASGGTDLLDLLRYPTPVLLLPLDATLRNAWQRATEVFYGFDIEVA
ncbi:hypothetical protein [Sphingomonas sp. ID0503]|uniref:hypothetical protein n=1 Tax=Sphingomonas sp. ID0503 TaxID=3399691 RepID=UPI003AFB80CA